MDSPALANLDPAVAQRVRELSGQFWLGSDAVDTAPAVPASDLEALASAGLYGVFAPVPLGGLGLGFTEVCAVVEELAAGCVASTFVWAQHLRLLGAVLDPAIPEPWRQRLQADVVAGRCKGGVALAGLLPGPPRLSAEKVARDAWRLNGTSPWVSGWGTVDKLVVVARGTNNSLMTFVMDAREHSGLTVTPLRLAALNATRTVRLAFDDVTLRDEQVIARENYDEVRQRPENLRLNGSFALGLAKRCCLVLGPSPLDDELVDRRSQLDTAAAEDMPTARAGACELAVRASHALAVSRGSTSALAGDTAERLEREANVLLVFGSRPGIRSDLLTRFHAAPTG